MRQRKTSEERRASHRESQRKYCQRAAAAAYPDLPMGEFAGDDASHLYIMSYDFDPCYTMGCKIGRSRSVPQRARELADGHCFNMKVLRVYQGCGHLERLVHVLLSSKRCPGVAREWFEVSFDTALIAVRLAKDLYAPRALGDGESCSTQEETEPCTPPS